MQERHHYLHVAVSFKFWYEVQESAARRWNDCTQEICSEGSVPTVAVLVDGDMTTSGEFPIMLLFLCLARALTCSCLLKTRRWRRLVVIRAISGKEACFDMYSVTKIRIRKCIGTIQ